MVFINQFIYSFWPFLTNINISACSVLILILFFFHTHPIQAIYCTMLCWAEKELRFQIFACVSVLFKFVVWFHMFYLVWHLMFDLWCMVFVCSFFFVCVLVSRSVEKFFRFHWVVFFERNKPTEKGRIFPLPNYVVACIEIKTFSCV